MTEGEGMDKAVHLIISGRVQGVSFRYYTRQKADELGVQGWVRNLMNGQVEAWAQGQAEAVDRLVNWCRQGPPSARVDEIKVEDKSLDQEIQGFEIRRTGIW
jgi:acylphosphatase